MDPNLAKIPPASNAPVSPPSNTNPIQQPPKNNSKLPIILGFAFIFLIVIGGLLYVLLRNRFNPTPPPPINSNTETNTNADYSLSEDQITVPFKADGTNVKYLGFMYRFESTIKEVRKTGEQEIILENSQLYPRILLEAHTMLRSQNANQVQTKPISIEDLQPGKKVQIIALYDVRINEWDVQAIIINE